MENNEVYDLHNLVLDDNTTPADDRKAPADTSAPNCGGSHAGGASDPEENKPAADDRKDPEHEPARLTADAWKENNYYAVTFKADPGDASKAKGLTVVGYDEYIAGRDYIHAQGYYITGETFQTEADYLPGLLTYDDAVNEFKNADERHLELKDFSEFSKAAKIKLHDSVVLAADTGAGKSSLAINFLNQLNDTYPVLYFNLEMDGLTILRRLVAIRTGIELDRIEGYQKDDRTAGAVNSALRAITSRKPLQILKDVYTLEDIEKTIAKTTEGREDPTIVIIDHSLLVTTKAKTSSRYERFTHISEELRRISRLYNVVLFILLQQNRAGKADENEAPNNSSLKESGSWENDATHIIFLWYDPNAKRKKLIITKNRDGEGGSYLLNYWKKTQTYTEAKDAKETKNTGGALDWDDAIEEPGAKQTKRAKRAERLEAAFLKAVEKKGGRVTLRDVADADGAYKAEDVRKEAIDLGGYTISAVTFANNGNAKKSPEDLIEQGFQDADDADLPEEWKDTKDDDVIG